MYRKIGEKYSENTKHILNDECFEISTTSSLHFQKLSFLECLDPRFETKVMII